MNVTGWSRGLEVTADGEGVVSHAGLALLRRLADKTGLTAGLSRALVTARLLGHDRGRVLADLACAIADGAEVISDFRVLGDQRELFGPVASVPTAWRMLEEVATGGPATAAQINAAVNAARQRAWEQIASRHGGLPGLRVADQILEGVIGIRLDATVTIAHSDKEGAQPNFKGFGPHPLLAYCDNTGEALAGMLRPGGAGSNTTADHLQILEEAIAAIPPARRHRLMITCDGAGASHGLIDRLDELAARPGDEVIYSVGWELGERERSALSLVPGQAWQIALDPAGEPRISRAPEACEQPRCEHQRCWVDQAHVTELTGLLREGPAGDQLAGWPASMRLFTRRERPHPGAQLSLFEERDGWRYSLWVTNLAASTRGWRGQNAYLDAAHRVHARVEDSHPHRQGHRPGTLPVPLPGDQHRVAERRADRRYPAGLAAPAGPGRRAGPGRTQDPALPPAAHRRPPRPRRPPPAPENHPHLALGQRPGHRLATHQRPASSPLTIANPSPNPRKEHPRGLWNPRPPGPLAG